MSEPLAAPPLRRGLSIFREAPTRPALPPFTARLEDVREGLAALPDERAAGHFGLDAFDRLLKTTASLCPECLAPVEALVYTRGGRVLMRKRCPAHGASEAVLENDERFYHLSNKDRWGRRLGDGPTLDFPALIGGVGGCCGDGGCGPAATVAGPEDGVPADFADQRGNKTCTVLVEVTDACNLACPVCYSDAKGSRKLPLAAFQRHLLALIEQKGGLDSVQLTGGEAVLHPEFWQMVQFLYEQPGVKKIYLPTNGILFARPEVAERLLPFRAKLMVLLQFDGRSAVADRALRGAEPGKLRERALAHLGRLGIQTQLTMTITRGVNDGEIGAVIDHGFRHDHVKVIALQPVTYSGRYDLTQDPLARLTLSDVVKAVAAQVERRTRADDFLPIPCSHPNCGWITLFVRRFGLSKNIARSVDLDRVMNQVANRTLLKTEELRAVVGTRPVGLLQRVGTAVGKRLIRSTDVFAIAVKPFMDRFSYDQDRISACCHHLLDTHGRPVSFCEYNARLRQVDPWDRFPAVAETGAG